MKPLYTVFASVLLLCTIHATSYAQSVDVTESFKKHFNETVQEIQRTEIANEKRAVLHDSFLKMISAIDRIESMASIDKDQKAMLSSYKLGLTEMLSELNGLDGFNEVADGDLDDFSGYAQDFIEQADRTITVGVTSALLILIVLLLLL